MDNSNSIQTIRKSFTIFAILMTGCVSSQRINPTIYLGKANKDVVILATMCQDFFKNTEPEEIDLDKLAKNNPSSPILSNFEKVERKYFGGHISVYYKFSSSRLNFDLKLNDKEKELLRWVRFYEKRLPSQYDGEIRIGYPEKFYHIYRIQLQKK